MNVPTSLLAGAMALALTVPAAAQYETTPSVPATPETTTEIAPGTISDGATARTTTELILRTGPGTEHRQVTVLPEGTTVEVQDCLPGWCGVTYDGLTGYASTRYLDAGGTASALEAPETERLRDLEAAPPVDAPAVNGRFGAEDEY